MRVLVSKVLIFVPNEVLSTPIGPPLRANRLGLHTESLWYAKAVCVRLTLPCSVDFDEVSASSEP